MEKIEIRDLLKFCFIENLQYSRTGKHRLSYLRKQTRKRMIMKGTSGC